ncbi:hypothetical protein [Lactiplantibacillus plantarum]|uniref:hypothetical protein n=1 Tax=Lactiplantibacillus plantarum TaxID=1590 RepID=UPI003F52DA31
MIALGFLISVRINYRICHLLKQYAKLKRDLTTFNQVSSPSFDGVSSHSSRNGTESRLVNHVDLSYQLKEVEDALNTIDDPQYQFILHDYIIEKRFNRNEACNQLSVSVSKFNYLKNRALEVFKLNYLRTL